MNSTPLHIAAFNGHSDITLILIKCGATLHAIDEVSISIIVHVDITINDCDLYVMS